MSDKVGWGVLSTSAHAANSVIPAMHAAEDGEVVAVASRDDELARRYADAYNIPNSYGSYEALLAAPEVDVVYIPLPNNLHKEWSIKAAQAGKHVLCEKPIGLNAAEAEEMAQAFNDAGLKLAEAFQWRHHPQGNRVREMLREGVIGELRFIDAGFSFFMDSSENIRWLPELGGGALYDVGCYPIALARFITGQEPLSVTAQAHWSESGIDDLVVATLEFPGGVLAHINCAFTLPLRRYYEITGAEGTLTVNYAYNPIGDRANSIYHYGHDFELLDTIDLGALNSYTLMIQDFNHAVQEDGDLLFPAEDAIANMRVIDAIFKAIADGVKVELSK